MSDDLRRVMNETTIDVPAAGRLFGLGEAAARRAAAKGTIPTVRVGGKTRALCVPLCATLGLEWAGAKSNAA